MRTNLRKNVKNPQKSTKYAEHVVRREAGKWSPKFMEWGPYLGKRIQERPQRMWYHDLKKTMGLNQIKEAHNGGDWKSEKEAYVLFWMNES